MRMAAPVDQGPPYAAMVHAALRSLVRSALRHAAEHGLPGEHHFYLTFRTDHPGTAIPARLLAQYPEEITIVLQHQFWDLKVQDDAFSVGLSFGGVPAALTVPFDALTGFADPAMQSNPFADVALMVDKERGFALRVPPVGGQKASYAEQDAPEAAGDAPAPAAEPEAEPEKPQVVSLDAFRKRGPDRNK
jgi:uncharacterized protein